MKLGWKKHVQTDEKCDEKHDVSVEINVKKKQNIFKKKRVVKLEKCDPYKTMFHHQSRLKLPETQSLAPAGVHNTQREKVFPK